MTNEEEEAMQRMVEICSNLSGCVEELFVCLGDVVDEVMTHYYPTCDNLPTIIEARRLLKHYDMSDDGEDEEGDDQ